MSKCPRNAKYRYTWPGRDEALICEEHAQKLKNVSAALGLHLQLIELSQEAQNKLTCDQQVGLSSP